MPRLAALDPTKTGRSAEHLANKLTDVLTKQNVLGGNDMSYSVSISRPEREYTPVMSFEDSQKSIRAS